MPAGLVYNAAPARDGLNFTGLCLGPGGGTIKSAQQATGAHIEVSLAEPSGDAGTLQHALTCAFGAALRCHEIHLQPAFVVEAALQSS